MFLSFPLPLRRRELTSTIRSVICVLYRCSSVTVSWIISSFRDNYVNRQYRCVCNLPKSALTTLSLKLPGPIPVIVLGQNKLWKPLASLFLDKQNDCFVLMGKKISDIKFFPSFTSLENMECLFARVLKSRQ